MNSLLLPSDERLTSQQSDILSPALGSTFEEWSFLDSTLIDLTWPNPQPLSNNQSRSNRSKRIGLLTAAIVTAFLAVSAGVLTTNGNAVKRVAKRKVVLITNSNASAGPVSTLLTSSVNAPSSADPSASSPVTTVAAAAAVSTPQPTIRRTTVPPAILPPATVPRTTVPRKTVPRTTKVRTTKPPRSTLAPVDTQPHASPLRNKSLVITNKSQAAAAPCAGRPISATPINDLEQAFLLDINAFRVGNGLAPLVFSNELADAARVWSTSMSTTGLAHQPNLLEVMRVRAGRVAENVGFGPSEPSLHQAFLESPPHLRNILDSGYTTVAFGAVVLDGTIWVTVRFADNEAMSPCNYL
jgi:uncharacterized protein YkwD